MSYFSSFQLPGEASWTRSETINSANYIASSFYYTFGGNNRYIETQATISCNVIPFMNLPSSVLVSDGVSNGYYSFVFNEPPVIQTINNIQGNFGSVTNISYVATDNDDAELKHYISFDNGTKWQEIKPTRNGNIYTYSHVFNELNTYYCRVKVVDSAKNEVVSNAFAITVNAVAPDLPATTLADKCYYQMFYYCTSLTTAPKLPATTLADFCYQSMFYSCTSLTKAPDLPATTLADYCYYKMFSGCTSLTKAPDLPAKTLAKGCYSYMFKNCSSLNYIKMLATDISADSCLSSWVLGVSETGTFVKSRSASWEVVGNNGVPDGWTVKTDTK